MQISHLKNVNADALSKLSSSKDSKPLKMVLIKHI